jgi:hypothetical protein
VKKLNNEMIENFSKIVKGGKDAAIKLQKKYGDIIKKEEDKYGNIKYFFNESDYLYYDPIRAEMALEDWTDDKRDTGEEI